MGRRSARALGGVLVVMLAVAMVAISGCGGAGSIGAPTPKVKPPVIGKAGVLRAAVDLSYPPFGGTAKGVKAGLDVDVASALAERLGLTLQIVDAKPEEAAAMLRDHKVDVAVAALPIDQTVQLDVAFAGSYVSDGPAVFSLKETTVTIDALGGRSIAAQTGSAAYWLLAEEYGEESVTGVPTLRDAFAALTAGQADFAAGDGIVGAYLLRDFPTVRYNGQIASAVPLGVAVAKDSGELEKAVRSALDDMSAQGVLETLRRTWMGEVPRLRGADDAAASGEASATP